MTTFEPFGNVLVGAALVAARISADGAAQPKTLGVVGTHDYDDDPRNANVLFSVNGELVRRPDAKVSVMDAGFLLGDGVWESFHVHRSTLVFWEDHVDRLFRGAEAIALDIGRSRDELRDDVERVLAANDMRDGVHVRLIVTRGLKPTPYQDPRCIASPPTIVIIPEHKRADPTRSVRGIRLVTVDVRRGEQNVQDPRINSLSKHNCIAACVDAARKGGEEGLMLDPRGYVATCNSTHFFAVRGGEVWTSTGEHCLDGITRRKVLDVCRANDIPAFERDFTVEDVHTADEAFVTGTFAGLIPVIEIDGIVLSGGSRGPIVERLQGLYTALVGEQCGGD